ncbi:ZF-HD dimerization-type domain-containing protein [Psidium guajava]|nr:ZF-HD dimerization-type domain-containing protein [Psidium guajava]
MKKVVLVRREEPSRSSDTSSSSSMTIRIRYAECQKNYAASTGGQIVDGCTEFRPQGEEGSSLALDCATCGCHRNFHRKVVENR